jgi:hypothetical protein
MDTQCELRLPRVVGNWNTRFGNPDLADNESLFTMSMRTRPQFFNHYLEVKFSLKYSHNAPCEPASWPLLSTHNFSSTSPHTLLTHSLLFPTTQHTLQSHTTHHHDPKLQHQHRHVLQQPHSLAPSLPPWQLRCQPYGYRRPRSSPIAAWSFDGCSWCVTGSCGPASISSSFCSSRWSSVLGR